MFAPRRECLELNPAAAFVVPLTKYTAFRIGTQLSFYENSSKKKGKPDRRASEGRYALRR
jgi:hypothetical protein